MVISVIYERNGEVYTWLRGRSRKVINRFLKAMPDARIISIVVSMLLLMVMLGGCAKPKLKVVDPGCHTDPILQVTLCIHPS